MCSSKACLNYTRPNEADDYKTHFSSYVVQAHHHSAQPPTTLSGENIGLDWYTSNAIIPKGGIPQRYWHIAAQKASLPTC